MTSKGKFQIQALRKIRSANIWNLASFITNFLSTIPMVPDATIQGLMQRIKDVIVSNETLHDAEQQYTQEQIDAIIKRIEDLERNAEETNENFLRG